MLFLAVAKILQLNFQYTQKFIYYLVKLILLICYLFSKRYLYLYLCFLSAIVSQLPMLVQKPSQKVY